MLEACGFERKFLRRICFLFVILVIKSSLDSFVKCVKNSFERLYIADVNIATLPCKVQERLES